MALLLGYSHRTSNIYWGFSGALISENFSGIEYERTYFYQYEIYRAPDKGLTDITLIASIPNSSIEHFQDRNAGNGTTWYYSVSVVDVNGQKKFSEYISGWSSP